jgi:LmbE family N-acetylglucosaminyl deacetylase
MTFDWAAWERVIILSPHLDDAVFSCFGILQGRSLGRAPLVVTVFAGDAGRSIEDRHGIELPGARRAEDARVMESLSCQYVHLGFHDAIDRVGAGGELSYPKLDQVFGSIHRNDDALPLQISAALAPMCQGVGNVLLVAPISIGMHVDHALVGLAAKQTLPASQLLFYEDFPYVVAAGKHVGKADSTAEAFDRLKLQGIERVGLAYHFNDKLEAMDRYGSQIEMVFGSRAEMISQMKSLNLDGAPAEFYWRALERK